MSRFGGAAMAEAGHPSIGGWRTVTAWHREHIHSLRPAARLRGQRTVRSVHARRFGASCNVVALSEAQDRTLFSRVYVALKRTAFPSPLRRVQPALSLRSATSHRMLHVG